MSITFNLRVEGISQNIAGVQNLERDMDTATTNLIDQLSKIHQTNLKYFIHVWQPEKPRPPGKPHARDTIREERRGPNYVVVTVPVVYAQTENRRPGTKPGHGPHNFADQAANKTSRQFASIGVTKINDLIKRNKIRIVVL